MRDWLENEVFGLKIRILQVWCRRTSLKRSSDLLSERVTEWKVQARFPLAFGSLKQAPQRATRLEPRLSELDWYGMPGNPFLTYQNHP